MKPWIWLRGLAVLLAIFAVGHTLGTAAPKVTRGPQEAAVFAAMQGFRFPVMGFQRTYWDFHRGFALIISLQLLLMMAIAWQLSTISRQNSIAHRRTAYHHPEGNSYIERFHRSLKEEEIWPAEYRSLEEARASVARWIEEYNHDRPHRGVENRTPYEAFLAFGTVLKKRGPACLVLRGALQSFLHPLRFNYQSAFAPLSQPVLYVRRMGDNDAKEKAVAFADAIAGWDGPKLAAERLYERYGHASP